jgi:arsenate reductase (thioredoxin)
MRLLQAAAVAFAILMSNDPAAAVRPAAKPATVVFVCEHGAAKSVLAAAYFNQLAAARHLNFRAVARGVTPQADLSTATVAGLRKDQVPFSSEKPRLLTTRDLDGAARVVAFCPLPAPIAKEHAFDSYDVPAPIDGYDAARDAIVAHVKALVEQLAAQRH